MATASDIVAAGQALMDLSKPLDVGALEGVISAFYSAIDPAVVSAPLHPRARKRTRRSSRGRKSCNISALPSPRDDEPPAPSDSAP